MIQICSDHSLFYRDALRYLGCVELKDIPGTDIMAGNFGGTNFHESQKKPS